MNRHNAIAMLKKENNQQCNCMSRKSSGKLTLSMRLVVHTVSLSHTTCQSLLLLVTFSSFVLFSTSDCEITHTSVVVCFSFEGDRSRNWKKPLTLCYTFPTTSDKSEFSSFDESALSLHVCSLLHKGSLETRKGNPRLDRHYLNSLLQNYTKHGWD